MLLRALPDNVLSQHGAVDTGLIHSSRTLDPHKRDLEAEFVAQRGLSFDHVAQRIIRGIERRQARLRIGRDTCLIGRFQHRVPFL